MFCVLLFSGIMVIFCILFCCLKGHRSRHIAIISICPFLSIFHIFLASSCRICHVLLAILTYCSMINCFPVSMSCFFSNNSSVHVCLFLMSFHIYFPHFVMHHHIIHLLRKTSGTKTDFSCKETKVSLEFLKLMEYIVNGQIFSNSLSSGSFAWILRYMESM